MIGENNPFRFQPALNSSPSFHPSQSRHPSPACPSLLTQAFHSKNLYKKHAYSKLPRKYL